MVLERVHGGNTRECLSNQSKQYANSMVSQSVPSQVTAHESLDATVSSSTTIVIDVLDVQDNSPVFERDSYFAETREDAPVSYSPFLSLEPRSSIS